MKNVSANIGMMDRLIKNAKLKEAHYIFKKFENKKIPRKYLVELCHLARRLNKPYQIIKWLHPYVRSEKSNIPKATEAELSLYVIGLARIGAYKEGSEILKQLDQNTPDVILSLAQLNVYQWRYTENIRILKRYLKHLDKKSYSYHMIQVNLFASLVADSRWNQADTLKQELLNIKETLSTPLLKSNILEIYAQSQIQRGQYQKALASLQEAAKILKFTNSPYELFIEKWSLIIKMLTQRSYKAAAMRQVQQKAIFQSDYETLRDLDFYQALATKDLDLFIHVYRGTRFTNYRKKMIKIFQPNCSLRTITQKKTFSFTLQKKPTHRMRTLPKRIKGGQDNLLHDDHKKSILYERVATDEITSKQDSSLETLDFSQLSLRPLGKKMLKTLLSDFYHPIQLGEMFRALYPNEHFHPVTSKDRLYKIFSYLKKEILLQSLPIAIQWSKNQIQWMPQKNFVLHYGDSSKIDSKLSSLKQNLPPRFNIHDVKKILNKSQRTCERHINILIAKGLLKRLKPGTFEIK